MSEHSGKSARIVKIDVVSRPSALPGGPYDVIVASLGLHVLAGHQKQETQSLRSIFIRSSESNTFLCLCVSRSKYSNIFSTILLSLKPGGMLVYGDHVGTWGLFSQVVIQ